MSLKMLSACLRNGMHKSITPADLPPGDDTPDFVKATLDAANRRYAKEAARAQRKAEKAAKDAQT